MNRNPVRRLLSALTHLLPFACAHSQETQDTAQPGPVTLTGSLRSRMYAWDANCFAANHSNPYAAMLLPKQLCVRFDSRAGHPASPSNPTASFSSTG